MSKERKIELMGSAIWDQDLTETQTIDCMRYRELLKYGRYLTAKA